MVIQYGFGTEYITFRESTKKENIEETIEEPGSEAVEESIEEVKHTPEPPKVSGK